MMNWLAINGHWLWKFVVVLVILEGINGLFMLLIRRRRLEKWEEQRAQWTRMVNGKKEKSDERWKRG